MITADPQDDGFYGWRVVCVKCGAATKLCSSVFRCANQWQDGHVYPADEATVSAAPSRTERQLETMRACEEHNAQAVQAFTGA